MELLFVFQNWYPASGSDNSPRVSCLFPLFPRQYHMPVAHWCCSSAAALHTSMLSKRAVHCYVFASAWASCMCLYSCDPPIFPFQCPNIWRETPLWMDGLCWFLIVGLFSGADSTYEFLKGAAGLVMPREGTTCKGRMLLLVGIGY